MPVPTSNLILDLQAGVGITASSGRVSQWDDQSGAGNHVVQATGAEQPYDTTDANGDPCVRFPMELATFFDIPGSLSGISTRAVSMFAVCNSCGYQNGCLGSISTTAFAIFNINGSNPLRMNINNQALASPVYIPLNKSAYGFISRAAATEGRWNNTTVAGGTLSLATGLSGGSIGATTTGTSPFFGDVHRFLVYGADIADAQCDDVMAALIDEHDIVTTYDKTVVFPGDSITLGAQCTLNMTYPRQAILGVNEDWLAFEQGIGGQTIAQIAARFATWSPLFDASNSRNVLCILAGTNDVNGADSAATIFGRITDFAGDEQLKGWETWVHTIPDRAAFDTKIGDVNTLIRAGDVAFDEVMDIGTGSAASPRLDDAGSSTYYQSDAIHLKDAGYGLLASVAIPLLEEIMAATPMYNLKLSPFGFRPTASGITFTDTPLNSGGGSIDRVGWGSLTVPTDEAITAGGFRYVSRTGTPVQHKIGLQGLDASGLPDGTYKGGGSPVSGLFTPPADTTWNATWRKITFDNAWTPDGSPFCMVIEPVGTPDGSNFGTFSYANQFFSNILATNPRVLFQNDGAAWSASVHIRGPIYSLYTANRVYGCPVLATAATALGTNGHRAAGRWTPQFGDAATVTIGGFRIILTAATAGGSLKLALWTGTTESRAVTYDSDNQPLTGEVYFNPITLNCGTEYRLGVERVDVSVTYFNFGVGTNSEEKAIGNTFMASSTWNGSAWADVNTTYLIVEPIILEIGGGPASGPVGRANIFQNIGTY